ncbi:response regulator (plasmid) [Lichenicola cladoniae]|uniref:Response regulator n=1 Tax=Lichenicola cladoniae TaxID=1484109 RepID=A0A6M8HZR0_9PROT|nr:response regulator [Lichenicola cladoniae]NPD70238.1 response regulator [Acetobacteraceae bacterium]QKE93697.1 response regulator [Lichenicola cladoniae]
MAIRILFAEDEGLIRMMTAESLRDEGFDVVDAWDGDEPVRLLEAGETFDIVVTDVHMPGSRDGIDVAVHARRLHPRIPVIVASAYEPNHMPRLAILDPAAIYIGKPYSLVDLMDAVRRLTTLP